MVFTGIVECMGTVAAIEMVDLTWSGGKGHSVTIKDATTVLTDVALGDSIACDGICLTVTEFDPSPERDWFKVGIAPETERKTIVSNWKIGDKINLERAMNSNTRFGGHIVQGHVDTTIILAEKTPDPPNSIILTFHVPLPPSPQPDPLMYIIPKGYVALNGVSLTVVSVDKHKDKRQFQVMLVSYTQTAVNLLRVDVGGRLNLEVDEVGKYIESVVVGFLGSQQQQGHEGGEEGGHGGKKSMLEELVGRIVDERVDAKLRELNLMPPQ